LYFFDEYVHKLRDMGLASSFLLIGFVNAAQAGVLSELLMVVDDDFSNVSG